MAAPILTPVRAKAPRITSVDGLRGFVMVVMALDHTREFFTKVMMNPLDPRYTSIALYFTRWITHLCAPVFVLLAGTAIYLQHQRKTDQELTRFLLTRGLWLILVELTLVHLVFNFNFKWNVQLLEVIWVIGASMVLMSALFHLGVRWNLIIGAALIIIHNSFDRVTVSSGALDAIWHILHVPGSITGPPIAPPIVIVAYPLIPWVGVMALGYSFGRVMMRDREYRMRFELRAGLIMLAAFAVLRWINIYGDPVKWTAQATWWRTVLSFFNVMKYPPSLLFLLATLGFAALIMRLIESAEARNVLTRTRAVLDVYGRVPFFYFLLHIALVHLFALSLAALRGGTWRWWISEIPRGGVLVGHPEGYGYGLGVIWCVWILVVALCYPACKWYASLKRRSRNPLLSYF